MNIENCLPRLNWKEKCEVVGFNFHSTDGLYWNESRCYSFTSNQIDKLSDVTEELHAMAIAATSSIIEKGDYKKYGIPESFANIIESSWRKKDPSLYGRMDLSWSGQGEPKLLEYNADTPTSLLEASVVQWDWLVDYNPGNDQFNSIHEKLIARWQLIGDPRSIIHLAAQKDVLEDINTTEYLFRVAEEAGLKPEWLFMDDIGWCGKDNRFVDLNNNAITQLFKLYPLEWLLSEEFSININPSTIHLIEPVWKVITSSKAILVKMWEMFPGHLNLLPSYFEPDRLSTGYVRKPVFSREGANIQSHINGVISETSGIYTGPFVYQEYQQLPKFDDRYTLIGSWIVGDDAAGIGIREDVTPITRNTSQFIPHYFKD